MNNLKSLYESLEKREPFEIVDNHTIEREFQSLAERYKQNKYKKICKWEMMVWGFYIENGILKPQSSWALKDGSVKEYPSLDNDFGNDAFYYISNRASRTKNVFLKARYNHLLWQSKYRHRDYAIEAINSYQRIINSKNKVLNNSKSLLLLSYQSKHNFNSVLKNIKSLIEKKEIKDYEVVRISSFVLDKIKSKLTKPLLEAAFEANNHYINNLNLANFTVSDICDINIRIGKRLNKETRYLSLKKAEHYLETINSGASNHNQHFYFKAIQVYSEIGEKEKCDELYVLIEKSKDEIRMGSFRKEMSGKDIQDIFKAIEFRAERLTDLKSNKIYEYLAANKEILPKTESFYKKGKSSFLDLISTTSYDINSNFKENDTRDSLNLYGLHLSNFSIRELVVIFQKGVIKGSISYRSLVNFLYEKSWIGKTYSKKNYDGKDYNYCLLETLFPSLLDFFKLFEANLKNERRYDTAYILCTDSLALKIEGLIRHFARLIDCPTIIINKNKDGTRERYIEEIVSLSKFKEYLNDDDIMFILYLMTNKGMNIRNNVAHSFYSYKNYSVSLIVLLINLMLRLSKFDIK